jgi:lysophospholipase L1-like esterase
MYERVADEEGCLLVARTLKGILTDPALRSDQIHPNARGYDLMAKRMTEPFAGAAAQGGRETRIVMRTAAGST